MPLRFAPVVFLCTMSCVTAHFTHGAAIGELSSTDALLWVRTSAAVDLNVLVTEEGTGRRLAFTGSSIAAADSTARIALVGLRPATAYSYEIRISGAADEVVIGQFRTAPPVDRRVRVRFVFGGDIAGQNVCRDAVQGFPIFQVMDERMPDFFIGLGDLIYADSPCLALGSLGNEQVPGVEREARTLEDYRRVWRYVRGDALYQRFLSRVPIYSIWDDHEVRNDFSPEDDRPGHSGEPRLLEAGARAFVEFNPVRGRVPGTFYRKFAYGRSLELFILDTRSKRDPNAAIDVKERPKTMLGAAQRAAFVRAMKASTSTWKFVVSSVPLSVPSGTRADLFGSDGWAKDRTRTGYENELRSLLLDFARAGVKNIVFLVTDVHFAAVHRYRPFPGVFKNFVFYEMITGPLQAGLFPTRNLDSNLKPERLFYYGPQEGRPPKTFAHAKRWFNFGEVEVAQTGKLELRVITAEGTTVFSLSLPPR